jgi:hypothetical protein
MSLIVFGNKLNLSEPLFTAVESMILWKFFGEFLFLEISFYSADATTPDVLIKFEKFI